jgi:hypothetical protein
VDVLRRLKIIALLAAQASLAMYVGYTFGRDQARYGVVMARVQGCKIGYSHARSMMDSGFVNIAENPGDINRFEMLKVWAYQSQQLADAENSYEYARRCAGGGE